MDIMTVCTIPSKITVDTDNDTNALGLQFTLALKNSFLFLCLHKMRSGVYVFPVS